MWRLKGSKLLQSALRYKPLRRISLRYAQSTIPLDFINERKYYKVGNFLIEYITISKLIVSV